MCLPVEPFQNRVICQRDLVHEKHASLLHGQHQGAVMPLKQPPVLAARLHANREARRSVTDQTTNIEKKVFLQQKDQRGES